MDRQEIVAAVSDRRIGVVALTLRSAHADLKVGATSTTGRSPALGGKLRSPLQVQRPNAVRPYIRGASRAEDLPL